MALWIVGDGEDLATTYVRWLAEQRGVAVTMLEEARFGLDWWYALTPEGEVTVTHHREGPLATAAATGAFVRLHPEPAVPPELDLPSESRPLYLRERRAALQYLLDALPFPVVNRPSSGRSNGSKPYQMARLTAAGFRVPRWIATNDPLVARELVAVCPGGAIVKSCSGVRSHVRRFDDALAERLVCGTAPIVLQEFVEGQEVRVHVLGPRVFATAVHAPAVEDGTDGADGKFQPTEVPRDLVARCQAFAAADGVDLAGFDFRVDRDGQWWALDMSAVPTFLPYEAGAGHPIGASIVDLLAPESRRRRASVSVLAAGAAAAIAASLRRAVAVSS